MRRLFFALMILPFAVHAQEKLNSITAPTSPASGILGLQPKAILAPKSYQALESALYSNFMNNSGSLLPVPNNFALEFTPYWATDHHLSLDDYLFPTSGADQLFRNSSFSIASTNNFMLGDSTPTNGLGFGYRTTFYFGNQKDRDTITQFRSALKTKQRISTKIAAIAEGLVVNGNVNTKEELLIKIKPVITQAIFDLSQPKNIQHAEAVTANIYQEAITLPNLDRSNPDPFLDSLYALIDKNLHAHSLYNQFKSYLKTRYGFSADIAYAASLSFPTNNFQFSVIPQQSFWITPAYHFKNKLDFLKIMGVIRYEWYDPHYYKKYFPNTKIHESNIDYGIALGSEFQKFSFQLEVVKRNSHSIIPAGTDMGGNELFRKEESSDIQYIGSFNYRLTQQIVLSYSLGNRFNPIQNPGNTLVSMLSLNFGFGAPDKSELNLRD